MKKDIIKLVYFSKYLLDLTPNYIKYIKIFKNEICIYVKKDNLTFFCFFIQKHLNCKFTQLVDICGVDYPNKKERFEVIYNFLSISFNFRLRVKITTDEMTPVNSISNIYQSGL